MARKTGQINSPRIDHMVTHLRLPRSGNSETQVHLKIHLSWTAASTDHLYRMLAERDLGRNIHSSRQTVGQYLDHWLSIMPGTKIGFGRVTAFRESAGLNRHVVGVQVPAGKEVANPS